MANIENAKNVVLLAAILLGVEVLGNKLSQNIPADDIIVIIVAGVVVLGGIYFHVIKG